MRSVRVSAALAIALFVVTIGLGARPSVNDSVYPLAWAGRGNICTTTSIDQVRHHWLTAAHCVHEAGEGEDPESGVDVSALTIRGDRVTVILRDEMSDVAVLYTQRESAPAVALARTAPKVEDAVKVVGYPFGFTFQVTTKGAVAAVSGLLDPEDGRMFTLFNITGAPGNSGSAILNARGEIVSVLQIGWGRTFSPMVGGIVFETLTEYRSYFEQR